MIVGWAIEQLWLSVWRPLLAPFWLPHLSCYKALIGSIGTFDIFGEARWGGPKAVARRPEIFSASLTTKGYQTSAEYSESQTKCTHQRNHNREAGRLFLSREWCRGGPRLLAPVAPPLRSLAAASEGLGHYPMFSTTQNGNKVVGLNHPKACTDDRFECVCWLITNSIHHILHLRYCRSSSFGSQRLKNK